MLSSTVLGTTISAVLALAALVPAAGPTDTPGCPSGGTERDTLGHRARLLHPGTEGCGTSGSREPSNVRPRTTDDDRSSTSDTEPGPALRPLDAEGSWRLLFDDEFNGTALNRRTWLPCVSAGWTPQQGPQPCAAVSGTSETYDRSNDVVSDGILHQLARPAGGGRYSSGSITTAEDAFGLDQTGYEPFHYTYGFLEVRMRAPTGPGMWPAVWQMPRGGGGHDEMDLMESLFGTQGMTLHGPQTQGNPVWGQAKVHLSDFATHFHVFGADWTPGRLTWYVDGKRVGRTTRGVPRIPESIQANLQIGGQAGSPSSGQEWPVSQDIDYVRVFRRGD